MNNTFYFKDFNDNNKTCSMVIINCPGTLYLPTEVKKENIRYIITTLEKIILSNSLKTIYIPETIKDIKENTLEKCQNLTTVYFYGTQKEWNLATNNREYNFTVICEKEEN